jgi:hypothetical protein
LANDPFHFQSPHWVNGFAIQPADAKPLSPLMIMILGGTVGVAAAIANMMEAYPALGWQSMQSALLVQRRCRRFATMP